ncbi:MAG: hypothetical protein LBJ00_05530 [Planctomycetaceae bacterium]|nr:hypothetical protein [Planctomycetaceae bacterium]
MKFPKRNTQAQQREAVAHGRSLSPYRLRYNYKLMLRIFGLHLGKLLSYR